jgi:NTE family protein
VRPAAGQRELTDLLLRPPLEGIDLLDWQAFDRAIDLGYRYAARTLERHRELLTAVSAPLITSNWQSPMRSFSSD